MCRRSIEDLNKFINKLDQMIFREYYTQYLQKYFFKCKQNDLQGISCAGNEKSFKKIKRAEIRNKRRHKK